KDTIAENNVAHAFTLVEGPPLILLVEGSPGEAASISAALDSLELDNRVIPAYQFPASIEELQRYAVIILCNVPAEALQANSMEAVNQAVKNMGLGLIMVGGDQSFGPGGYFKTPVEEALPVYMDLRGKKEIPSLGLLLVIDKSGSMSESAGGYAKIDLAREAAIQATEVLGPMDQIGVLAFDSAAKWVVKMRKVDDLTAIQDDIGTLRAGGGTSIYPGLALAYDSLKKADTKYKHIILLTDGQSATSGDYYFLARKMEKAGITMSTVAVGDGADTELLEILAEWGRGRYYFTNEAYSIPRIFTKETITALRSYLVEEDFTPLRVAGSEVLHGINAVPDLHGYVASTVKDSAQLMLESHRGDPVLAGWQYGLGRSLAFTSDAGGRWAANWAGWEGYNHFWGNLLSWVLPRSQDSSLRMETYIEDGKGYIKVDTDDYTATSLMYSATIIKPDLKSETLELQPVAPGSFAGNFKVKQPGVYLINVLQKKGGETLGSISGGAALSYSPEYNNTFRDDAFLEQVAGKGGGSIISRGEEAFADNLPPLKGIVELWPWLLIIAACLLPLDIAARRLSISRA
ncbi:MAG: VWA domain-containing protein, partial [Syntrophomonadaceae bacterium]|nr:VWA domain-containing protein [Syntrophomonadaceae bacterium]